MKQSIKLILGGAILLALPLFLTSCEDILGEWSKPTPAEVTPAASVAVTSITLSETTLNKNVGDAAVTLKATVKPDDATDKTVTWSSDKPAVATVADGVVTFKGPGTAIIKATANDGSGVEATCTVTVTLPGLLTGKFTINSSGKQIQFSQGNLQATYDGSAWTWKFATNQWDYIGGTSDPSDASATANNKVTNATPFISENGTVDLFGWVGASSNWGDVNQYGITSSTTTNNKDGYGDGASEALKADWGTLAIGNGGNTPNSGWRTLTSGDDGEWKYLFNSRTVNGGTGSGHSYTLGQSVNGKLGIVIYPDDYTGAEYATGDDWATFEAAGCVFLPAAGYRNGTEVNNAGTYGFYWSSSPKGSGSAYYVDFGMYILMLDASYYRYSGRSVRLVRAAE